MIKNYCEQIVTLAARAFEGVKSVPLAGLLTRV